MRILLLTDTIPGSDTGLGALLGELCLTVPAGSLAMFVARGGDSAGAADPLLSHVPQRVVFKPGEYGLVGSRGQKVVRAAGMVREFGRRAVRVPPLVSQAVRFGRQQKVDAVWAVVTGQTTAHMATPVARRLRVPLYLHVPEHFEGSLLTRFVDPVNRRAARVALEKSLHECVSCAVSTSFVAEDVQKRFGINPTVLFPAVPDELVKLPAIAPRVSDRIVIGFAGSAYQNDEWRHLIGALDEHGWRAGGRDVSVLTYGNIPPPTPGPPGRVLHRHYVRESELVQALSSEADVLYCPQPFVHPLSMAARGRIPHKLVTYLSTGRPIIFHGPIESAAYDILKRASAAVLVTGADRISIWTGLHRIATDEALYGRLARAAHQLATSELATHQQQRAFAQFLTGSESGDVASARPLPKSRRVIPSLDQAPPAKSEARALDLVPGASARSTQVDVVERARTYALEAELQRTQSAFDDKSRDLIEALTLLAAARREIEGLRCAAERPDTLPTEERVVAAHEYIGAATLYVDRTHGDALASKIAAMESQMADLEQIKDTLREEVARLTTVADAAKSVSYAASAALQRAEERNDALHIDLSRARELAEEQAAYLGGVLDMARQETRAVELKLAEIAQERAAELTQRVEEQDKRLMLEQALEVARAEIRSIEHKLDQVVQERIALAHAAEVAELRVAGRIAELVAELSRARGDAERLLAERTDKILESGRLQERIDGLVRELHETRLELVAQNVRLANSETVADLRAQLHAYRSSADAAQAEGRAQESHKRAEHAEQTLEAVQRAHADEIRAGIEFLSKQIAEAKALEATEGRIAGRMSIVSADLADIKKGLVVQTSGDQQGVVRMRTLYLDLLESSLCGMLSSDPNMDRWSTHTFDKQKRLLGRDWPRAACTMIGAARMRNVRTLVEKIVEDGVEGDFLEAGVWRGGACIYMKGILLAHGQADRRVWLADSFKGLPLPEPDKYPADKADQHHEYVELRVSVDDVRQNFEAYGLLDENVSFLEGWFKDTLPSAPVEKLAMLRLDGDMYSSTMETLEALYGKVVPGGFVIVDDYILEPCRQAITDFRARMGIDDVIESVDGAAVYWRKAGSSLRAPVSNTNIIQGKRGIG